MSKKRETRRQQRIRKALIAEVGGYWRKIWGGPFQQAGIPDLLGCVQGFFFAFEVKEYDGTPSELQLDEINEIIEAGGCAAIVYEPDQAVQLVRDVIFRAGGSRQLRDRKEVLLPSKRTGHRKNHHNLSGSRKTSAKKSTDHYTTDKHRGDVGTTSSRKVGSILRVRKRRRR